MTFDVIVIGLGGMGSAAAAVLARRGVTVLGLEQHAFMHPWRSSHGRTRIIRTAYYEHPAYVPLVRRAFTLWAELERRTNKQLLTPCPCLTVGEPGGELVVGVRRAAAEHALPVEAVAAAEVERRYPQLRVPQGHEGVLEQSAGILAVEECVLAQQQDARAAGADLRAEEPVVAWRAVGDGVEVTTAKGTYSAGRLVVTAGPWATTLVGDMGVPLSVMRQVQWWFGADDSFRVGRFPVFLLDTPQGAYYGIPVVDGMGVKCARHYGAAEVLSPDGVRWDVEPGEETAVRGFLSRHLPDLDAPPRHAEVCMYTLTPDRHFVIDRHPEHPQVAVACGFSGHGFKFAPTVGEVLADLAVKGKSDHPIDLFRAGRFR